jgi:hypothetical protein
MRSSTDNGDVFNKWAALPEWEKQARRFGANENAIKVLKILSLIVAMLSWPFR